MIDDIDGTLGLILLISVMLIIGFFVYMNNKKINSQLEEFHDEIPREYRKIKSKSKTKSKTKSKSKSRKHKDNNDDLDINDILDFDMDNDNINCNTIKPRRRLNTELIEQQYHKDYADTITGINNLTPQKELFNMGFLPVHSSKPTKQNVDTLVEMFVGKLNKEVGGRVSEYLNINSGWHDQGKIKRVKSGFEEQMENLGLPSSIYTENADKAPVELVAVTETLKETTDDQVRISITMVLQKVNVKDQIVVCVKFFMEKEDLKSGGDHRENFFDKTVSDYEGLDNEAFGTVIIEIAFIEGFLTNSGLPQTDMDKFHNYDDIMTKDGIVDQYKVMQIMKKKHRERSKELNSFLCSVDDQTKVIHDVPGIGDFESYKTTRTIMDDLEINPQDMFNNIHM